MTFRLKDIKITFEKVRNPFGVDDDELDINENNIGVMEIPRKSVAAFLAEHRLYNMHMNFPFSEVIVDILDNTDGVETFEVLSNYRALVSFGKLFDRQEVQASIRRSISEALSKYLQTLIDKQDALNAIEDHSKGVEG